MSKLRLLYKIDSKKSLMYALFMLISAYILITYKGDFEGSYILWILALVPTAFAALYTREAVRNLFNMDELERRIYLESISIATALSILIAVGLVFFSVAGLVPVESFQLALPIMPVLMLIIIPFRAKAYDY